MSAKLRKPISGTDGPPAAVDQQELAGALDRVIFHNPDTKYTVALFDAEERGRMTIVGCLYQPLPGQSLQITGSWKNHAKYGRQFDITSYQVIMPTSADGIERFLSGRFVKGIGPRLAERIVKRFGEKTLDVLDQHPERLREVNGIGQKKLARIIDSWEDNRSIRQLILFLGQHGISAGLAARVHARYGPDAVAKIRENPYQLALEVERIGFQTADQIALKLGLAPDSRERAQVGLLFTLHQQAGSNGHCCLPRAMIQDEALKLLGLEDHALIEDALEDMIADQQLIVDDRHEELPVYLPKFHRAERDLASSLAALNNSSSLFDDREIDPRYLRTGLVVLAEGQKQALCTALTSRVSIITGGPGVGKTTLIRRLVAIAREQRRQVALAAPTGRAAKRLAEATDSDASTIHRLLRYNPMEGRFDKNESDKLEVDMMIIDEASMIDVFLMRDLVRALPGHATLVLVGDADQLPSVGPGNVLSDLINSNCFPVTRLEEVFRQSRESQIVHNAHLINAGHFPVLPEDEPGAPLTDFYYARVPDPDRCAEMVLRLTKERIPQRFGFDPMTQIQLITPMHRGEVGTIALNTALQEGLNPTGTLVQLGSAHFRVGDKVMQVRNNYDKEVFNGDIGFVSGYDGEDEKLEVRFDRRILRYSAAEVEELKLAYCITVHKSQGSEYPAVVLPLLTQHYLLLQRNLLYTAITRGKELVVLVGSDKALRIAIQNDKIRRRYSHLADRLRHTG